MIKTKENNNNNNKNKRIIIRISDIHQENEKTVWNLFIFNSFCFTGYTSNLGITPKFNYLPKNCCLYSMCEFKLFPLYRLWILDHRMIGSLTRLWNQVQNSSSKIVIYVYGFEMIINIKLKDKNVMIFLKCHLLILEDRSDITSNKNLIWLNIYIYINILIYIYMYIHKITNLQYMNLCWDIKKVWNFKKKKKKIGCCFIASKVVKLNIWSRNFKFKAKTLHNHTLKQSYKGRAFKIHGASFFYIHNIVKRESTISLCSKSIQ